MKDRLFILILICLSAFNQQCKTVKNDEDIFFEPIIEGTYNIDVDENQVIDFAIEPYKPTTVEGKFTNGISFKIEFPEGVLQSGKDVEAKVSPINEIMNLPSNFSFQFGYSFTPEGTYFNKPAKLTIDLPQSLEFEKLKGFIFEGGDPYQSTNTEIWDVKMVPIIFDRINGQLKAVVKIPHFSGFAGLLSEDFNCADPRSAESCEELNEIIACNISGKESLNADDIKKVNKALRVWLEDVINYIEENPTELDEDYEFLNAAQNLVCWKATALMFNNDLATFSDIIQEMNNILSESIANKLNTENNICVEENDPDKQVYNFSMNFSLMILVSELESAGFLDESVLINPREYCNGIGVTYYNELYIDTTNSSISALNENEYTLTFPPKQDPAVARSEELKVYAKNQIGDIVEIFVDKDYEIIDWNPNSNNGYTINGSTITENVTTCYDYNTNNSWPCYENLYGNATIRLLSGTKNGVHLKITRAY